MRIPVRLSRSDFTKVSLTDCALSKSPATSIVSELLGAVSLPAGVRASARESVLATSSIDRPSVLRRYTIDFYVDLFVGQSVVLNSTGLSHFACSVCKAKRLLRRSEGDVHTLVSADRNNFYEGCEEIVIKYWLGGALG